MMERTEKKKWPMLFGVPFVLLALGLPSCTRQSEDPDIKKESHAEEEEGHGNEVHISKEVRTKIGIKVVPVGPGQLAEHLHLTASVESDENAIVHVSSPVSGLVRAIYKGVGERVSSGELLAEIWSAELGAEVGSYLEGKARHEASRAIWDRYKGIFEERLHSLTKVLDGEIAVSKKIFEREKEYQKKGVGTLRPFLEAEKAYQGALLRKERQLTDLKAERDAKLLQLEAELLGAKINEQSRRMRLLSLGLGEKEIASLGEKAADLAVLKLYSPADGVIFDRHITRNESISESRKLFEIHDLSRVWVLASVYEKDFSRVRKGQEALIRFDTFPGLVRKGRVSLVDFKVNERTRAGRVRIVLSNDKVKPSGKEFPLRPGMFASVEVVTSSRKVPFLLPERVIVHEKGKSYLFIEEKEGIFEKRLVQIRKGAGGMVEVVKGLNHGDVVAMTGLFELKSLSRKGELGEGHEH
jgi:RND family efflux transporter MFP subunit